MTAEITNDPERDSALCVELMQDDEHRGRLQWSPTGELELIIYGGHKYRIPWEWLSGIASRFSRETRPQ
jgi:hypothetical protein